GFWSTEARWTPEVGGEVTVDLDTAVGVHAGPGCLTVVSRPAADALGLESTGCGVVVASGQTTEIPLAGLALDGDLERFRVDLPPEVTLAATGAGPAPLGEVSLGAGLSTDGD